MGSYSGTKICELVGILILSQLSKIIDKENKGLYRDNGLITKELNSLKLDKYREKISNALKLLRFKITIKTNLKITNFLDIILNLEKGTFKPFKKENDTPNYIHTSPNHPPSIIKQIPISISRRLSDNSSNINIFYSKKNIYNNTLKKVDTHNN